MNWDSGRRSSRSTQGVRAAFTLIEVMIVIAIVLALTGLVGYAVLGRRDDAKRDMARIDLNSLRSGLKMFHFDYDRYPTDEEGIKVLWDKSALSADADQTKWHKYMEEALPADRWGTEWVYKQSGDAGDGMYALSSAGPDKQAGTEDDISAGAAAPAGGAGATGSNEEAPAPATPAPTGG